MLCSAGERFFPEGLLGLCAHAVTVASAINTKAVIDLMTFPPFFSQIKGFVAALRQRPRSWITGPGKALVVGHCIRADLVLRDGCLARCGPAARTERSCRSLRH